MPHLRLLAVDQDDLAVISAHCQDAIVSVADCRWRTEDRQFALEMNRFVWESAQKPRGLAGLFRRRQFERRRAVLHFDRVTHVQRNGIDQAKDDQLLVLLAIRFVTTQAPSGRVELVFAGDATIRLDVEVIEAQLTDIGGGWSTESRPDHGAAEG